MSYGVITDEGIAALRARIGVEHPIQPWNDVTTRETIRHFADGLGDINPIFHDREYAGKSRWGDVIAPPFYLFTATRAGVGAGGLPGVHALWMGDVWKFCRPVQPGDRIAATLKLTDVIESASSIAKRSVRVITGTVFRNQGDQAVVGTRVQTMLRFERSAAKEKGKYGDITRYKYTESEVKAIEEAQDREAVRGVTPRYWEDVKAGDEFTPIVRGPLTIREMIAFRMGGVGGDFILAGAAARAYHKKHPGARIIDPDTGAPDMPVSVHWSESIARMLGMPAPFGLGVQRVSWFGNLVTNWMGDDGWLEQIEVQMHKPDFLGDTLWCSGKVAEKYVENGKHLVKCEIWGDNQRQERTTIGTAVVSLPSRTATS